MSWADLRTKLCGATNPAKADEGKRHSLILFLFFFIISFPITHQPTVAVSIFFLIIFLCYQFFLPLLGSIRAELLKNKEATGMIDVNMSSNGVHMSAGPLEGLVELQRFMSTEGTLTHPLFLD